MTPSSSRAQTGSPLTPITSEGSVVGSRSLDSTPSHGSPHMAQGWSGGTLCASEDGARLPFKRTSTSWGSPQAAKMRAPRAAVKE